VGSEKIEKKLPEDIITLIDQEAASKNMSRQEVISHLISAVKGANISEENKRLKKEIELVHKQQEEEHKEIRFLREEISKFSSGLTSLAVTIGEGRIQDEQKLTIESLSVQIRELSTELSNIKEIPGETHSLLEKQLPLIMVSVLAGLLLIYLILSKLM
jgi:hypothetical protein